MNIGRLRRKMVYYVAAYVAMCEPSEGDDFLNFLGDCNFHRQAGVAPGIKAADQVDHVLHAGAPEQTTGNHAAISALTMNRERQAGIEVGSRNFEMIQWEPCRLRNVSRLPLRLTPDIEHLQPVVI